jgi:hypothetical protein
VKRSCKARRTRWWVRHRGSLALWAEMTGGPSPLNPRPIGRFSSSTPLHHTLLASPRSPLPALLPQPRHTLLAAAVRNANPNRANGGARAEASMEGGRKRGKGDGAKGTSAGGKRSRGEWSGASPRSRREPRSSLDVFPRLAAQLS